MSRELDAKIAAALDLGGDRFSCPSCSGVHFGSSGQNHSEIHCHDEFEEGCRWSGPRDAKCFPPPRFSSYTSEAMQVVEAMRAKGFRFEIADEKDGAWTVMVWRDDGRPAAYGRRDGVSRIADSLPLAICFASLRALDFAQELEASSPKKQQFKPPLPPQWSPNK